MLGTSIVPIPIFFFKKLPTLRHGVVWHRVNTLPNDKNSVRSKLKAFADEKKCDLEILLWDR